jgi:hypothetical protein
MVGTYILTGPWWGTYIVSSYFIHSTLCLRNHLAPSFLYYLASVFAAVMVLKTLQSSQEQQLPWVETPLRESYALSQAAGWYGPSFTQTFQFLSPCSIHVRDIKMREF